MDDDFRRTVGHSCHLPVGRFRYGILPSESLMAAALATNLTAPGSLSITEGLQRATLKLPACLCGAGYRSLSRKAEPHPGCNSRRRQSHEGRRLWPFSSSRRRAG